MAEYRKLNVDPGALEQLKELARVLEETIGHINQLESELKVAKDHYKQITEENIPEIMDNAGLKKFETDKGRVISVEEKVRASLSSEFREAALSWLENNGASSIVKHEVTVRFAKGEQEDANALCRYADSKGKLAQQKRKVEPSTLGAYVREQLRNGEQLPEKYFNIYPQRVAKVK